MSNQRNTIIIGAGPAGIACAVQLKRLGHDPLIFEMDQPGGLLHNANLIENYPGFPEGISGKALVGKLQQHLQASKIEVVYNKVDKVGFQDGKFCLDSDGSKYYCYTLVIGSGTKPKLIDDITLPEEVRDKIFYDVRQLQNSKDQKIGIIGAGDAAFDYALQLGKDNMVSIFNRTEKIRSLQLLVDRILPEPSITYHENYKLEQILDTSEDLRLVFNVKNKLVSITLDYLIFATGREPCLDFLPDNSMGMINLARNVKKLFFIGDVKNKIYRQVSIATGDGIRAAMEIDQTLRGR